MNSIFTLSDMKGSISRDSKIIIGAVLVLALSALVTFLSPGNLTGNVVYGSGEVTVIVSDYERGDPIRDVRLSMDLLDDDKIEFDTAGRTNRDGEQRIKTTPGRYELRLSKTKYQETVRIITVTRDTSVVRVLMLREGSNSGVITCIDGTKARTCASSTFYSQPYFCTSEGQLVEDCNLCGCGPTKTCNGQTGLCS